MLSCLWYVKRINQESGKQMMIYSIKYIVYNMFKKIIVDYI